MPCYEPTWTEEERDRNMLREVERIFGWRQEEGLSIGESLCALCKTLSVADINKIGDGYGIGSLKEWYLAHLLRDYIRNKDNHPAGAALAEAEAKRLGCRVGVKYMMEADI